MHYLLNIFLLITLIYCILCNRDAKEYNDYDADKLEYFIFRRFSYENGKYCMLDKHCEEGEYCKRRGFISGSCRRKSEDGEDCIYDYRCKSGHCHRFKCKEKQKDSNVKLNGKCYKDEQCRFEQYCKENKCVDRQESGSCNDDSQCLSNYCSYFKCKPSKGLNK